MSSGVLRNFLNIDPENNVRTRKYRHPREENNVRLVPRNIKYSYISLYVAQNSADTSHDLQVLSEQVDRTSEQFC
jgi:hypothetical protein